MHTWMRYLVTGLLAIAASLALAGEVEDLDPLLRLLVKKGVITLEEALALQAEAEQDMTPLPAPATAPEPAATSPLKGLKIGTTTYVSYQNGTNSSGDSSSRFTVKRGYIDIRQKITDTFSARITPDVTLASNGDYNVRFKYLYGQFGWKEWGFLGKPTVEFGIAHMPWLDFEEHINRYRMQDTMFMERNGLFNSADAGVMFGANLGPELPEDYRKNVNSHYAGRWGSFQVGLYDGGGYHAAENNSNKALEGRFTLRPLPDMAPGFQVSLLGITGKGNVAEVEGVEAPNWDVLNFMLSYESPRVVATAQWYTGEGNQKGNAVGADGRARSQDGWSLFGEVRLDQARRWAAIGRFDSFDTDSDNPSADVQERTIVGVAWWFHKDNAWVLDYDRLDHSAAGLETEDRLQLTLQIKY